MKPIPFLLLNHADCAFGAGINAGCTTITGNRIDPLFIKSLRVIQYSALYHACLLLDGSLVVDLPVNDWTLHQVDEDGKPFSALPALFERLGGGPWSVYRFLVQAHPELGGLTGREALRRGKADLALEVAESISQGTFA